MKKYLRKLVIFFVIFVILWQYFPLITFKVGFEHLLTVVLIFTVGDSLLRPLFKKIPAFPVNKITSILISFILYTLLIFAIEKFMSGTISIMSYTVPQIPTEAGNYGPYQIEYPYTYVVCGAVVVIFNRFLTWVFKKDEH